MTILHLLSASINKGVRDHAQIALEDHQKIFKAFCDKDEQQLKTLIKSVQRWEKLLDEETTHDNNE